MSEVEWTNDAIIELVKEYSRRPELWDSKHSLYRTQAAKYDAWATLALHFDCDIPDLRKKLNSIFASHRREKAKVRAGGHSTWFLYPYMKFWPTHLENNDADNTTSKSEQEEPSVNHQASDQASSYDSSGDNESIQVKQEPIERPRKRYIQRPLLKSKILRPIKKLSRGNAHRSQLDSRLVEALKLLKKSEQSRKKDECDSFGEYIATSLRKHDERTQSMIKQAINNILFEQEMKKYSAGQYTVVLTGVEENPLILGDHESDNWNKSNVVDKSEGFSYLRLRVAL